jgi:hypothetical protein
MQEHSMAAPFEDPYIFSIFPENLSAPGVRWP